MKINHILWLFNISTGIFISLVVAGIKWVFPEFDFFGISFVSVFSNSVVFFTHFCLFKHLDALSLSCGRQDLLVVACGTSTLIRDETQTPCIGSMES